MKFDPNARNRLDRVDRRKSNRIEVVEELPNRAERGDIVHMRRFNLCLSTGKMGKFVCRSAGTHRAI